MSVLLLAAEAGSAEWIVPVFRHLMAAGYGGCLVGTPPAVSMWRRHGLESVFEVSCDASEQSMLRQFGSGVTALISSATSAPVEAAAHALARRYELKAFAFIDAYTACRSRLTHQGNVLGYDGVMVIDDLQRQEAISEGLPAEMLHSIGQPAWEAAVALPDEDRRKILFVGQPVRRYYGDGLPFDEDRSWRALVSICRQNPSICRELGYALHPEQAVDEVPERDWCRIELNGHKAIQRYGTVVGMFSSLLSNAYVAGRKVVSFQLGAISEDYCGLSRRGLVPRAVDEEGLVALLSSEYSADGNSPWAGSVRSVLDLVTPA